MIDDGEDEEDENKRGLMQWTLKPERWLTRQGDDVSGWAPWRSRMEARMDR